MLIAGVGRKNVSSLTADCLKTATRNLHCIDITFHLDDIINLEDIQRFTILRLNKKMDLQGII